MKNRTVISGLALLLAAGGGNAASAQELREPAQAEQPSADARAGGRAASVEAGRFDELVEELKGYAVRYYIRLREGEKPLSAGELTHDIAGLMQEMLGVEVPRDAKEAEDFLEKLFLTQGDVLDIRSRGETATPDLLLGTLVGMSDEVVSVEGVPYDIRKIVVSKPVVPTYDCFVKGMAWFTSYAGVSGEVYLILDNLIPHVDSAWQILQGEWDAPSRGNPLYEAYIAMTKKEYEHLAGMDEAPFKEAVLSDVMRRETYRNVATLHAKRSFACSDWFEALAVAEILSIAEGVAGTPRWFVAGAFAPERGPDGVSVFQKLTEGAQLLKEQGLFRSLVIYESTPAQVAQLAPLTLVEHRYIARAAIEALPRKQQGEAVSAEGEGR